MAKDYDRLGELILAGPCPEEEHVSLSLALKSVQETQHM